ncbi:MAG: phage terminase large subunit [Rhodospirillales bacterium]|nr:phage terminase large subunit [Rhodospirillales bacterium]
MLREEGRTAARHHRMLIERLDALASGEIDRLMVLMPPGSAKSTYCSIVFPVWFLARHPRSAIIAASHTADLATHFGRQARAVITEHADYLGYALVPGERAATRWATSNGGHYFATGVQGPLAGRRADLVIVDDPIRSRADADSKRRREHVWEWLRADLITRLRPGGRMVLVMTRWHPDDVAGRLMERTESGWSVLRLPALAEKDDPLGRQVGEPLWPEWEDLPSLLRTREQVGARSWAALYQQAPILGDGISLKVENISITPEPPEIGTGTVVRAWDLAATAEVDGNDPDYTVGLKLLREADGRLVVLDVVRERTTPLGVEKLLLATARRDGSGVMIDLPQDPGQAGKAQVAHYFRLLVGYPVRSSVESGPKIRRSLIISSQIELGTVTVVQAPWNRAFLEELREFPSGRKDDQVDALTRAVASFSEAKVPARRATVSHLGR